MLLPRRSHHFPTGTSDAPLRRPLGAARRMDERTCAKREAGEAGEWRESANQRRVFRAVGFVSARVRD
jgi:hypothetical protein